jgi:glucose-6-phosphate 1-dehydrogenase
MMSDSHSDALVFFGATGDLAHKKIFPSLQAMLKRGHLDVPVIGVAKSGWNLDQFRARARDSLEKHGGLDSAAFNKLCGLLRYVDGDYNDPATYQSIRKELGSARWPAHYLAILPVLFGLVVGTDLASAREFNRILFRTFNEASTFPIDHYLGKRCSTSASRIRFWSRSGIATTSRAWRSPWRRISTSRAAAPSTMRPVPSAT